MCLTNYTQRIESNKIYKNSDHENSKNNFGIDNHSVVFVSQYSGIRTISNARSRTYMGRQQSNFKTT